MDVKSFNPKFLRLSIPRAAPKIAQLFEKIQELDAKDMKVHKKQFKHMIFTDIHSSNYGAKLLASAFVANGFTPVFTNNLGLKTDEQLLETKGNNFGLLLSKTFGKKSMSVKVKKAQMHKYNERPTNTHGDLMRVIILDQGFKEGIDLFDVKYVHLFEPLVSNADQKQAIGRGTRFCGQKGLEFHPRYGWPLYVFRYDVKLGTPIQGANTLFELFVKYSDIDFRKVVFAAELEKAAIEASVDHTLTSEIHSFEIEAPPPILSPKHGGAPKKKVQNKKSIAPLVPAQIMGKEALQAHIAANYKRFAYPRAKLENLCVSPSGASTGAPAKLTFTPTQDFVRHYFRPESPYKGILLFHSVGSGKTCTAIATATSSFEREGYTILWVTRHTLKADIWKNMFDQVCHTVLQDDIDAGKLKLPKKVTGPMRYLSDRWIEPISYKQFSNLLKKSNKYYQNMVDRNGEKDPLRKTLVIIDEAHKLYAPNVVGSEKPDVDVLEDMIQNSYTTSGKDSVRLMLMTATPYTEDAMEMMKLMNNMRPAKDALPTDFNTFAKKYLDDQGYFTASGKKRFQDQVAGYISYVNRSQDGRHFAHPILENVFVNMTESYDDKADKLKDNQVKEHTKNMKEMREQVREQKAVLKDKLKGVKAECKEEAKVQFEVCKQAVTDAYADAVANAKATKANAIEKCKDAPKASRTECKAKASDKYSKAADKAKASKADGLAKCADAKKMCAQPSSDEVVEANQALAQLMAKLQSEQDQRQGIKAELSAFKEKNKELNIKLKELRESLQGLREEKKAGDADLKDILAEWKQARNDAQKAALAPKVKAARAEVKDLARELGELRTQVSKVATEKKLERISIGRATLGDISQHKSLMTKCLA